MIENCGSWPRRWAERRPGALAVVDERRRLDWRAFEDRVARLTGWLAAHNVGPGDRVALLLSNGSPYLEWIFASARRGAMAVPLNTRLAAPELDYVLSDAEPKVVVHDAPADSAIADALLEHARIFAAPLPSLAVGRHSDGSDAYEDALAAASPERDAVPIDPSDPMILMYTSGTTGRPKGALLSHRKTFFNCLNALHYFGIRNDDRVLVPAPLFHSLGLKILSLPALHAGAAVHVHRRFDADAVWNAIEREGVSYLGGVPTMHKRLLARFEERSAEGRAPDTSGLRFLFTAGAAIPAETVREFEARGLCLKQGYGQTETSTLTCLDEADAVRKAGSVGRPVFHVELRLVDRELTEGPVASWRDVAPGETGEVVARGPIAMSGYWRQPEETRLVLREDGWLRTGDLATMDSEGFVTLVGRAREMFISGGENVYPAEVEATYETHPALAEVAVVGVPDDRWGEAGCAFVVPRAGAAVDSEALRSWGAERLAHFKVPREFVALESLPRTASGKVQKHRLDAARESAPR